MFLELQATRARGSSPFNRIVRDLLKAKAKEAKVNQGHRDSREGGAEKSLENPRPSDGWRGWTQHSLDHFRRP